MNIRSFQLGAILLLTWLCAARATVYYVDINSTNPTPPYATWGTASTDIQSAIDAATNGDTILVNDGDYQTGGRVASGGLVTNRVVIDQAVTVESLDGPAVTIIQGYQQNSIIAGSNAVRCVYMATNAALLGFTLTSGSTSPSDVNGGGIFCQTVSADLVSNCVLTANTAYGQGGGVYQGTLVNCLLSNNLCTDYSNRYYYGSSGLAGGGAFGSSLMQCTVSGNSARMLNDYLLTPCGGGTCGGTASNCLFVFNSCTALGYYSTTYYYQGITSYGSAYYGGFGYGGATYNTSVANCIIASNSCFSTGVSEGGGVYGGTVVNSAIIDNTAISSYTAFEFGGSGGGACNSGLTNCTVANNFASAAGGGTFGANEVNCINYFNVCPNPNAYTNAVNAFGGSNSYCCSTPLLKGSNNISLDPVLAGVFLLSTNSPCVGAGSSAAVTGTDINGQPWANPPSMGCEEINPGNLSGNLSMSIAPDFTNLPPGYAKNFQANITGPLTASVWNFGDGTMVTNEAYISHAYAALGNYTISLTGYNNTYPAGLTATLNITVAVPTLYYVAVNSPDPTPPYSSWLTAALNIQDAVDLAPPGSLVLVTNGLSWGFPAEFLSSNGIGIYQFGGHSVYGLSNRLAITKPITVQSVNGPQLTWIYGGGRNGGVRGVYMTNGATLIGFTITNGYSNNNGNQIQDESGGGIWSESTNDVITNCIISGCAAYYAGSGVYSGTFYDCVMVSNINSQYGGGACTSVLYNCNLVGNGSGAANSTLYNCLVASNGGAGISMSSAYNCTVANNNGGGAQGGFLSNCILVANQSTYGGGAFGSSTAPIVLYNCLIASNAAEYYGGGAYGSTPYNSNNCVLYGCQLFCNSATNYGGGAAFASLNNSVIASNAALSSFNGTGGGVEGGILNNCLLTGNRALSGGGADCLWQGTSGGGILNNCIVSNNVAKNGWGGGAAFSILNNCLLFNNLATNGSGGGASSCTLSNCSLLGNMANFSGDNGGALGGGGAASSALFSCRIYSNSTSFSGSPKPSGGGTLDCTLYNCILAYNIATNGGGDSGSTLLNCTIVSNTALFGGGVFDSTAQNTILYDNSGANYSFSSFARPWLYYCCTIPPTNGPGNITNNPSFVSLAGGDFHLQPNSPCINSGDNLYVSTATDLDGNPRIVGGTVDMGAYEYQTPSSILSYAWAQQYGLPTDGSVDYLDLDGTGMPDWQKSIAGLNPTNPASVLAMVPLTATNVLTNGISVSWQSLNTRMYYLLRATNLAAQPAFSAIQSNLLGQSGTTSYTDTSATNGGPYFYRVGVQ